MHLARIKLALPGTSVGSQELSMILELYSYNWYIRFDLRHTDGASFLELRGQSSSNTCHTDLTLSSLSD